MLSLCAAGKFGAAHLLLVGRGFKPQTHPGLWETLARSAARQNAHQIAQTARQDLWEAGLRHADLALETAADLLKRGDHSGAGFVLREVFGPQPADAEARALLARTYLVEMRMRAPGEKPKTDADMARALAEGATATSIVEARSLSDLLQFSGEFGAALDHLDRALTQFPDDTSLILRKARLLDLTGDILGSIDLLEALTDSTGDDRTEALFRLITGYARLGRRKDQAHTAARLALDPLSFHDKCRLALLMDRPKVIDALLFDLASAAVGSRPITADESRALGDLLLDHGQIGHLIWLRRRRLVLSDRVKRVLDDLGYGVDGLRPQPASFQVAKAIQSPAVLCPVDSYLSLPAKPVGWPGARMTPGRILLVNQSLSMGGAERQLIALVKSLITNGTVQADQIDVACFSLASERGHDLFQPELEALGVRVHDLADRLPLRRPLAPAAQRVIQALPTALRADVTALYECALDLQPDTLHAWQDKAVLASGLVAQITEIPHVVLSLRNMSPETRKDPGLARYRALYQDYAQTARFHITANARCAAADYAKWIGCPADRIGVLTNGIDLSAISPAAPQEQPANAPLRIGGIFRLAENKRPLLWLDTVACLSKSLDRPVAPIIYGSGPLKPEVERHAAELGLSLQLIASETDPDQLYKSLDLVLLQSRVEGLPNVLIEAQARGIPVAACDVGGVQDATLRSGKAQALLFPADITAQDAATALAHWLPDALSAPRTSRHAFVARHFSTEALASKANELYTHPGTLSHHSS